MGFIPNLDLEDPEAYFDKQFIKIVLAGFKKSKTDFGRIIGQNVG